MQKFRSAALGICFILAFGLGNAQAADTTKQQAIEKLLEITKTAELTEQITIDSLTLFLTQAYKKNPKIPDDVKQKTFDILAETFQENMDGLMGPMKEVYDQTFTLEELQGLIRFYQTELGQKLINDMPALMQKSMMIGAKWGQQVGALAFKRIKEELASKGYEI